MFLNKFFEKKISGGGGRGGGGTRVGAPRVKGLNYLQKRRKENVFAVGKIKNQIFFKKYWSSVQLFGKFCSQTVIAEGVTVPGKHITYI